MTVYFNDAYRDNKFGYFVGSFVAETFAVYFDEVRTYRKDDFTFVLAGKFSKLSGVLRKFKPQEATFPVSLTLEIHKKDYEVKRKDDKGNWIPTVLAASDLEKVLYEQIEKYPVQWRLDGHIETIEKERQALKGRISFFEDPPIASMLPSEPGMNCAAWEIDYTTATEASEWTPKSPNSNYGKNGYGGQAYVDETKRLHQREETLVEILRRTHSSALDATDLYTVAEKLVPLYDRNPAVFDLYFKFLQLVCR
jgi:hypothetical protein